MLEKVEKKNVTKYLYYPWTYVLKANKNLSCELNFMEDVCVNNTKFNINTLHCIFSSEQV